jgi:hypothetical protein
MERALLEVATDEKEIKRLTKAVREAQDSYDKLKYKILRDEKNYSEYLGQVSRAASAEEAAHISVDKDYLKRKEVELNILKRDLDIALGIQHRINQVKITRQQLEETERELEEKSALRNQSKAELGSLPELIGRLDWEINSILLPERSRLKDALEALEREH